jgi:hypothetical protein
MRHCAEPLAGSVRRDPTVQEGALGSHSHSCDRNTQRKSESRGMHGGMHHSAFLAVSRSDDPLPMGFLLNHGAENGPAWTRTKARLGRTVITSVASVTWRIPSCGAPGRRHE